MPHHAPLNLIDSLCVLLHTAEDIGPEGRAERCVGAKQCALRFYTHTRLLFERRSVMLWCNCITDDFPKQTLTFRWPFMLPLRAGHAVKASDLKSFPAKCNSFSNFHLPKLNCASPRELVNMNMKACDMSPKGTWNLTMCNACPHKVRDITSKKDGSYNASVSNGRLKTSVMKSAFFTTHFVEQMQENKDNGWGIDDFHVEDKIIGRGKTSQVFKGWCKESGVEVAVKQYNKSCLTKTTLHQVRHKSTSHSVSLDVQAHSSFARFSFPHRLKERSPSTLDWTTRTS